MNRPKISLLCFIAGSWLGCSPVEPEEMESRQRQLSGPYQGTVDATSALIISPNTIVATHLIRKADGAPEPAGLAVYKAKLYPVLTANCTPCHAGQNAYP